MGDIDLSALGVCYSHEHLFGSPPAPDAVPDQTLDSESAAIQEVTLFRLAGGRALVEMTTPDYRRDVSGVRKVAEATGVHIICTTGHHKEAFSRAWVADRTVEELADRFTGEVLEGIDGTGIRAGVIKAASSLGEITPNEAKVFLSAARAHHATGAAISTHTEGGTMAMEQLALLQSQGVPPSRVIVGHVDRLLDWSYHLELARTGAYLGYDNIGKEKYAPDRERATFIGRLVAEGYGRQLLVAGDMSRKSYWASYGGGPGLVNILLQFVPALRRQGLKDAAIKDILVHNPARVLGIG